MGTQYGSSYGEEVDLRNRIAALEAGGGSPQAGIPVVRAFPFAFDTPGLRTGHAIYTPTVGDILLDAWIQIDTAWNGTAALFDMGLFLDENGNPSFPVHLGLFAWLNGPVNVQNADTAVTNGGVGIGGLLLNQAEATSLSQLSAAQTAATALKIPAGTDAAGGYLSLTGSAGVPPGGERVVPSKFVSVNPVKVCVSTTGGTDGADPGATQGAAVVYLVTCTPA